MRVLLRLLLIIAMLVPLSAYAGDVDLKVRAREMLSKHLGAIVSVSIVTRQRTVMAGRELQKQEQKSEVVGTVITPDGLTVVSNFMSNPVESAASVIAQSAGPENKFSIESEVSAVNLVLGDGSEIPARFVLRDKDLDVAFLKPVEKPAKPLSFVPMGSSGPAPQLLDDLIFLGRLGRVANREGCVSIGQVQALITKPRAFYVPSNGDMRVGDIGCPVFNTRGEVVGLSLIRVSSLLGNGMMGMLGGIELVVVPAEDVAEVARQATATRGTDP